MRVFACLAVACAVALTPPVLTRLVSFGLQAAQTASARATRDLAWNAPAAGWAVASWLAYGLCVWVLAVGAGAPAGESFLVCLAGVALAMTAGFLVVVAPSGIGVREAVLVAALAPVLTRARRCPWRSSCGSSSRSPTCSRRLQTLPVRLKVSS